jgi:phospholipid/cholesterol/gamma-HCH transport system permease protein
MRPFSRDLVDIGLQTLRWTFRGKWRREEILSHVVSQGLGSIPIIAVSTAFAGLVVTQEIAFHMDHALQTTSMIPGFTGQFITRELGIAVPALLIVAKVGASMTAEIGGMKVTEQIDALKLLGIDPVGYLVFPRWIASMIATTCLTLIALAVTIFCAILMAVAKFHFSWLEYVNNLRHFVGLTDLLGALVKSLAYGAVIPLIACTYGFRCQGGAHGVGSATTESVVSETIAVIVLDFILTYLFTLMA